MGLFDFFTKKEESQEIIVIPDELKNINTLLNEIRLKRVLPVKLPNAVLQSLKTIAESPNWYNEIDNQTINTLNKIYDKWQYKLQSKERAKNQKITKFGESGGFDNAIIEDDDIENDNNLMTLNYLVDVVDGSFELEENYKTQQSNTSIEELQDVVKSVVKYIAPNILNQLLDYASVPYFKMSKDDFKYRYLKMIKRIMEKTGTNNINYPPIVSPYNDLKPNLTLKKHSEELKLLDFSGITINNLSEKCYKISENELKASIILLYCEEIYANEWNIVNSVPPSGFYEGILYKKYQVLFDKKTEYIQNCDIIAFAKEQFEYFGFLDNGIINDENECYIDDIMNKITLIEKIPREYFVTICRAFISNYEKYEWGLCEDFINNEDGFCFIYKKKLKQRLNKYEQDWIIYLRKNNVPVKILRSRD